MRRTIVGLVSGVVLAHPCSAAQIAASGFGDPLESRIWLDRGADPVLQKGDRVQVYFRASEDAYLAVFRVDPDGQVRLLLPSGPNEPHRVRAGGDYQLPGGAPWIVEGQPGIGYFFVLASAEPFDFGRLELASGTSEWELARRGVRIGEDPHVAMEGFAGLLLQEGLGTEDAALDFTAFHIGQMFSYPRFLCYGCHEPQPFEAWNPYEEACLSVRVVISNDPYFYPATRYQGTRPTFPTPPIRGLAQFAFRARALGEPGTPVVPTTGTARETVAGPTELERSQIHRRVLTLLQSAGAVRAAAPAGGPAVLPSGQATSPSVVFPAPVGPVPGGAAASGPRSDPRIPAVLETDQDRPVLQRRVDQQGDPQ